MPQEFDLLTFGEIMLRLSVPGAERMARGDLFEKHAGGSELNVASGASLLGLKTGIISRLPANDIGMFIKNRTRFVGVSDDYLLYDNSPDARLGIYYYESGAAPRKPSVIYDRKGSSFTRICRDEINPEVFNKVRCFHTSGITLALSPHLRDVAIDLIKRFKEAGSLISFDVNYRATLWSEEEAREAVLAILPYVDILFISEETSRRMMQRTGELADIMRSYCEEYQVKVVATTQREVNSPRSHNFGSVLYSAETDQFYSEPAYYNIDVVDRIGSGDAFVSGVLFGLLNNNDPALAQQFGNAAAAVKNTIPGDLPSSDFNEISRIIKSHIEGDFTEMNR
ncbi:sugar kinase [Ruminococcaceae bacterium OttesenSCG-928-A16]|nr:sugar kinase [Ruminococcaceae bacterium OttesenSCG-928-A16]